jgi:hypothetical protein
MSRDHLGTFETEALQSRDGISSGGLGRRSLADPVAAALGANITVFCRVWVRFWVQKSRHLWMSMSRGGGIMAEQSVTAIPPDLAEAFAESVLAYNDWSPGQPEREIRIERSFFSITLICGLVEQFTDQLPEHVFSKLRSYMQDIPDSDLIVELAVNCSYATGARCLRRMIFRRKAEYRQRDIGLS